MATLKLSTLDSIGSLIGNYILHHITTENVYHARERYAE